MVTVQATTPDIDADLGIVMVGGFQHHLPGEKQPERSNRIEKKQRGKRKLIDIKDAVLEDSKASEKQTFKSAGQHRLRASVSRDDTRASSQSKKVCFQVS